VDRHLHYRDLGGNERSKKRLKAAKEIYIKASKGLPIENLAQKYPEAIEKLNAFNFCRSFNCLPESGGLNDQWADDYLYFVEFMKAEAEMSPKE
jgi:hypothetical protein